jgi:ABC-2 type transport system ATP-binding protein
VLEGTHHDLTAGAAGAAGADQPVVTFGAPSALDTGALAAAVGTGTVVTETVPGRYRVEAAVDRPTPAVTAAIATFLADQGATLTDLVAGKTLEDVYFDAVGTKAAEAGDDPVEPQRRGTRRRNRP